HLGANQVEAIDLATLQVGGVVRDVPKVHGVRVASDLGAVYASATSSDMVVAIDASTLTTRFRGPTGHFPDWLPYDPDDHAVFVSDKDTGSVTVSTHRPERRHERSNSPTRPATSSMTRARTPCSPPRHHPTNSSTSIRPQEISPLESSFPRAKAPTASISNRPLVSPSLPANATRVSRFSISAR